MRGDGARSCVTAITEELEPTIEVAHRHGDHVSGSQNGKIPFTGLSSSGSRI